MKTICKAWRSLADTDCIKLWQLVPSNTIIYLALLAILRADRTRQMTRGWRTERCRPSRPAKTVTVAFIFHFHHLTPPPFPTHTALSSNSPPFAFLFCSVLILPTEAGWFCQNFTNVAEEHNGLYVEQSRQTTSSSLPYQA